MVVFAIELSIEQGSKPWRPVDTRSEENRIHKPGDDGVEFYGNVTATQRKPPVSVKTTQATRGASRYNPTTPRIFWYNPTAPTQLPIVDCRPNAVLNLTGTGLKTIGDGFIDSSNTRELYLDKNGITYFSPMAIASMNALEVLSLNENNLSTGNILWYKEHKNLRKLVVDGNKWRVGDTSIRKTLQPLPKLQELSLRRGNIVKFEVSLKKFAPSLIRLDLSGNEIESTDFLDDIPGTLSQLYLDDNAISKIKKDVLYSLTDLSLSGNKFKKLCRDCSGDGSSSWSSLDLHDMWKLSTLTVARNGIDAVSEQAFKDTVHLVKLDLSGNGLTSLPKNVFHGLNELKELRLSNNKFVAVPNVCPLRGLKLLDLSNNVIEALADLNFCASMYVETVLLANNRILHVVESGFLTLQRLRTLDLSNNLIDKIPLTLITSSNLQELSLRNNKITDINPLFTVSTIEMVARHNTLQKLRLEGNPFVSQKIDYMPNLTILLKELEPNPANVTATNSKDEKEDDDNNSSASRESY